MEVMFPPTEWECRYAIRIGPQVLDVFRWTGATWKLDRRLRSDDQFTVKGGRITTKDGVVWIRANLVTES